MSTFSGLNTAYTGLVAARNGLDVVGQNLANTNTAGYTRQRVSSSAIGAAASTGLLANGVRVGQGVSVDGIARLGNIFLDAKVRSASASAGYWGVTAGAMSAIETTLQEPGKNGLSAQLSEFWSAWHDLSNRPGDGAASSALLGQASVLSSQIARGYTETEGQWTQLRTEADGMVNDLNTAGAQVAELNARIRSTLNSGGNANELLDMRSALTTTIATIAGGTSRELPDGTVEVLIGGNALVSGDTFNAVQLSGGYRMADAAGAPVRLEWAHRPGSAIALDGGEVAGAVSALAPSDVNGKGGAIAEAAEAFNKLAVRLAEKVNTVHRGGATPDGTTGHDFFGFTAGVPAAAGLTVIPTDASGIAAGAPGDGGYDGSIAGQIAQLAQQSDSPNALWASLVTGIGVSSRTAAQQSTLANLSASAAVGSQLANASVDIDEENVNMLTFQLAYQGAARVMTAVDEMLDTLINRTGIVGR